MRALDVKAIASHFGGEVSGNQAHIPTPNHSKRDRGTSILLKADAPDGLLVNCHNGTTADALVVKDQLREAGFLPKLGNRDTVQPMFKASGKSERPSTGTRWREVAAYEYDDGAGSILYRTKRLENGTDKRFTAECRDGDRWTNGLGDIGRVPYRLGELRAAVAASSLVYFVEGERKADKLVGMGFAASAIPFGCKGWREDYAEHFRGARVCIMPDNDDVGREFAAKVYTALEGVGAWPFVLELPGLPPKGDVVDWTGSAADLDALTKEAFNAPEPDWLKPRSVSVIEASPYQWRSPDSLPRRPWIYGRQLLRGSVFVVIAPGATGKSALMTGTALSLCTGRPLLGQEVWGGAKRVWLWNLEDSLNDLAFSIQGAALHWGLTEADIGGRLFVDSGLNGSQLKLAMAGRDGAAINRAVSEQLVEELKRRKVDVLVIDPFISSHGLQDENDNAAIDLVAKEWARIATAAACAIVLVHHSKKLGGAEVTVEASRGASALTDAARGGLALNTMTKVEADGFGIAPEDRRRFFRADDAKPNRAPAGSGQWFELVSSYLGNGVDGGDSVGVATPWNAPDPFADLTTQDLRNVQARLAGGDWRENVQAKDWAGKAVAEVLGIDVSEKPGKKRVQKLIREWVKNGVLVEEWRPDKNGDRRNFIIVGDRA